MMAVIFSLLYVNILDTSQVVLLTGAAAFAGAIITLLLVRETYHQFLSLFFGLLLGWLWCCSYLWLIVQPAQVYDGRIGELQIEFTDFAEGYASYGVSYGVVTQINDEPCRLKAKIYLKDCSPDYVPGDVLVFSGELRAVEPVLRRNLLQEGYFLTVSQRGDPQVFPGKAMTPLRKMQVLSAEIAHSLQTWLPGDEGALLSALLSGDRSLFSAEFDRALTVSGTRHITAVSGLHISILAGIMIQLFGKRAGLLISVPAAISYAALVGFSPSVVRAVILLVFWATSFWLKLERDSLTAMAAALLILVAYNPFASVSAGLLLSFSATLGLILLSAPLNALWNKPIKKVKHRLLRKLLHYVCGTITATLAATAFTMPLNILFFDTVPLLSVVSNLLILWAVSLVMILGILVLLISVFSPAVAGFLARWVLYWPLKWMVTVIRLIGSMQYAATDSANMILAAACLLLLGGLLFWRIQLFSGRKLLSFTAVILCVSVMLTAGERMLFGIVEIQNAGGQPVILLRSAGLSLINCGSQSDTAADAVETAKSKWNVDLLDTILCTTGNYKSQGGLPEILQHTNAGHILLPSGDGTVSESVFGEKVFTFTRSGTKRISGIPIQLFRGEEEAYAFRLTAKRFSLLSLCGLRAQAALTVIEKYPCSADVLLVDDALANDWSLLYTLCSVVQPSEILVTSNGYSEHGESFVGIPLTLIGWNGVQYRFLR